MTTFPTIPVDHLTVHKHARAEALITDIRGDGDDTFIANGEVPRGHWLNHPAPGRVPAILGTELVRQAAIAISHLCYRVPADSAFTMQRIHFRWAAGAAPVYPASDPFRTAVHVRISDATRRKETVTGLRLEMTFGDGMATGGGELRCFPRAIFNRIRGAVPKLDLIRHDPDALRAVRRTEDGFRALLAWDAADPFYFDHHTDHVPGMVFAGAMLAGHRLLHRADATGLDMRFDKFAELPWNTVVHAAALPDGSDFTFQQRENRVLYGQTFS